MVETRRQKALRATREAADDSINPPPKRPKTRLRARAKVQKANPERTISPDARQPTASSTLAPANGHGPDQSSASVPPSLQAEQESRWNEHSRFDSFTNAQIIQVYGFLDRKITVWKSKALPLRWPWDEIPRRDKKWLLRWAPNARQYWESQGNAQSEYIVTAWIWRIIWEALLSPKASVDKWRGKAWKAIGQVQSDLGQSISAGEPYDSDLALHYRCTRFGLGRHAYRQHGTHSDPERLKRKIKAPFKHVLRDPVLTSFRTAEQELSILVGSAIRLDFWKHFSAHPVVIEWSDPFTGMERGFPARERYDNGAVAMKGQFLHYEHDHTTVWGHEVELIRQPFLRVFGHADKPHGFPLYSTRNADFCLVAPAHVFVNCARRPRPEIDGEGGGSGDDGESEVG